MATVLAPAHCRTLVVVAPHNGTGAYAAHCTRLGWGCIAVIPAAVTLPPAHAHARLSRAYDHVITYHAERRGAAQRTARQIRRAAPWAEVEAVVAGGPLGVQAAEHLAQVLDVAGNSPATFRRRTDRGIQAQALTAAYPSIAAPVSLRTSSRTQAMRWIRHRWITALHRNEPPTPCIVLPASTGVSPVRTPTPICRTAAQVDAAWRAQRRAAWWQAGSHHLVVQEVVPGPQYVIHTLTCPREGAGPAVDHRITQAWVEHRFVDGTHDRSYVLDLEQMTPPLRALADYVPRALDALGVEIGPMRCRVAHAPGGPVLLSARAYPHPARWDAAVADITGVDPVRDAVYSAAGAHLPHALLGHPGHVMRVSLHAPACGGTIHPGYWNQVTSLPTLRHIVGPVCARTAIPPSTGTPAASPGDLIFAGARRHVDRDYAALRALESTGLYQGDSQ